MTNFDFLKNEPKFKDFADVAISAERIFQFDYAASVLNCRRAMEFAVPERNLEKKTMRTVSLTWNPFFPLTRMPCRRPFR